MSTITLATVLAAGKAYGAGATVAGEKADTATQANVALVQACYKAGNAGLDADAIAAAAVQGYDDGVKASKGTSKNGAKSRKTEFARLAKAGAKRWDGGNLTGCDWLDRAVTYCTGDKPDVKGGFRNAMLGACRWLEGQEASPADDASTIGELKAAMVKPDELASDLLRRIDGLVGELPATLKREDRKARPDLVAAFMVIRAAHAEGAFGLTRADLAKQAKGGKVTSGVTFASVTE